MQTLFARRTAVAIALVLPLMAVAQVTAFTNRTVFQATAPQANIAIDFNRNLASGTGTGSLPTFTEAGFVAFNSGSNYTQQIADGFNLGQGGNDVYTSQALNKNLPTANVTFGAGVRAVGFDFKNTANGLAGSAGMVPQSFTFNLFAGAASLGSFASATVPDGSSFSFLGFTSTTPITGLTIVATVPGASPNLDIVLDNFAVATPVPEPTPLALSLMGLVALTGIARLRKQRAA